MEIVGTMHIKGLQNFKTQAHILNPADRDIENDKLWNFAAPCKGRAFLYRFIIKICCLVQALQTIPRQILLLTAA